MAKTYRLSNAFSFMTVITILILLRIGQTYNQSPVVVHGETLNLLSDPAPYIEAEYTVNLDPSGQALFVTATFNHLRTDEIYIGFEDYLVYGGSDLTSRISHLEAETAGVDMSAVDTGIYRVATGDQESLTFSYQLDPRALPPDHHLITLTNTTLQLPGVDFFIRVEEQAPSSNDDGNPELNMDFDLIKSYQVTIENLPPDWEFPSTYTQLSSNSVLIDDRSGDDILLSAGKYKKIEIASGDARITVAFDRGLDLDVEQYARDFEAILRYYYDIYQDIPEKEILMVVNRHPKEFIGASWSMGGQAERQNIVNMIGWGPLVSTEELRSTVLSHLAHEGHHIWFMDAFNLTEDVYWWSEGLTSYINQKAVYKLGIISEEQLRDNLLKKFVKYNSLSIKNEVNLVQASLVVDPSNEESSLQYDKGALVAYLLDRKLQAQGKDIETFLTDFYRTYALPQKPLNNQELIHYIDSYLGDSSFTEEYVLGTEPLPLSEFGFGWRYYWGTVERYLPPVPFPYNILIPLIALLVILAVGRLTYRTLRARILLHKGNH